MIIELMIPLECLAILNLLLHCMCSDKSIPSLSEVIDESSAPLQREFSQLTEQQV